MESATSYTFPVQTGGIFKVCVRVMGRVMVCVRLVLRLQLGSRSLVFIFQESLRNVKFFSKSRSGM